MHKIRARLIGIITSKSSSLGKLVSYFSRSSPSLFFVEFGAVDGRRMRASA